MKFFFVHDNEFDKITASSASSYGMENWFGPISLFGYLLMFFFFKLLHCLSKLVILLTC